MTVTTLVCNDGDGRAVAGVNAVDHLCERPGRLMTQLEGADGLVLVLHEGRYALSEVQKSVRLAGMDPLAVRIVEFGDDEGEHLERRIAGASARAATFPGSASEQAKPVFPRSMSRRGFLSPSPEYVAVPLVDLETCVATDGCRVCVETCPRAAYAVQKGKVAFNKDACDSCGQCVTGCPAGAIQDPAVTPAGIEAQIRAIVGFGGRPATVTYVCSSGAFRSDAKDWVDVEVPCTGMIPSHWLLAPLLLGARAVAAVPCSASGCLRGHDDVLAAGTALARRVLEECGFDPNLIGTEPGAAVSPIHRQTLELVEPFGTRGAAQVVLAIAAVGPRGSRHPIEDAASPCGLVEVDGTTCTMCTMCAQTCPTNALTHGSTEAGLALSFDPALCVACDQCTAVCPERARGAIRMRPAIDFGELSIGRRVINTAVMLTCEICTKPVAPAAMMERIRRLLGSEQELTSEYVQRRCLDCRGA